ncbi:MAG: outer membrane protein assembly factor BamC [Burkholderiales bacterium]
MNSIVSESTSLRRFGQPTALAVLVFSLLVPGCSLLPSISGESVDYKSAGKAPSLDVPPDLSQLSRDSRFTLPGASGSVSASAVQTRPVVIGSAPVGQPVAVNAASDLRIERAGNQRWLVVNRPAEQLWGPVRDFWQESGFLLTIDQANLGIMETDWAENRAKIPLDFIRRTIGRALDSLYSSGEQDRFRTRLERTSSGATEIYISHRGLSEVFVSTDKDTTVWQQRPSDPELEAEFLNRLMARLGASQEQVKTVAAATNVIKPTSRLTSVNNTPAVQLDEGFDRAWRRVGLTLDRTGFTVEDRDRSKGLYFVRYVEPVLEKKEEGFFSISRITNIFGSSKANPAPLKYRIAVNSQAQTTTVTVLNEAGAPEASANAQRIVKIIADDLK